MLLIISNIYNIFKNNNFFLQENNKDIFIAMNKKNYETLYFQN